MICEGRRYDLCLRVKYGNDAVVVYLCGLPFAAAAAALAWPNWHAFFYKARSVLAVAFDRSIRLIHESVGVKHSSLTYLQSSVGPGARPSLEVPPRGVNPMISRHLAHGFGTHFKIQRQKSMIHVFEHSSNVDPCIQRQVRLCFRATQNLYFRQQELYDGDAGSVSDREEKRSEETLEEK
nr:hypothetical protein Iba_chr02cCG9920 [Ipomoea batatas]